MKIIISLLVASITVNIIVFTLCSVSMVMCFLFKPIRRIFSFFISNDLEKSFKDIELLSYKELAKGIYSMMESTIELLVVSFMLYIAGWIFTILNLDSLFIL